MIKERARLEPGPGREAESSRELQTHSGPFGLEIGTSRQAWERRFMAQGGKKRGFLGTRAVSDILELSRRPHNQIHRAER